ncbi:DASH complex subunit spc19 [Phialemonium atrogriseum]|uniref:DASH complex subunit SPC19 n=1 Tax=Phialemonium atrogriseum TaxID=1093897 RepID=A0AAJ0FEA1_9PEZI|nr:DASH complex subunit spc19 [Phialemonium atrogriseum]KAK1764112.1 DASH complex subunit spc19 [Phialemonium atrogriseum]
MSTSNPNTSTYNDCVTSLRTSLSFLESSVATLGNGVADFPRLISVLKTVRHYELIPQPTLAAAESSLRDDIAPFIAALLDRADRQLERQARRIETLKARSDLIAGRLSAATTATVEPSAAAASAAARAREDRRLQRLGAAGGGGSEAALRGKVARQRREALKYSVERLELEVLQKERELRLRLDKAKA